MRVDDDLPDVILTLLILTPIILFIGLTILNAAGGSAVADSAQITQTEGQTVELDRQSLSGSAEAKLTQGNALAFDNQHLTGATSSAVDNGSWTVTAYAELDTSNADTDAAYTVLAYNNSSIHLAYDSGDWLGYYNNSTHSAVVTLDAPNPGDGATLSLRYNGSDLRLATATTANSSALTTGISSRNRTEDWTGTLDEVRAFGNAVPTSRLDAWHGEPAIPLDQQTRLVRYLFDEGSGSDTKAWFAGTRTGIGGASWTSGISGPGLSEGSDYSLSSDPSAITILQGGTAYGAPVVFLSWGSPAAAFLSDFGDAVTLAGTSIVLLIGVYAAMILRHSR